MFIFESQNLELRIRSKAKFTKNKFQTSVPRVNLVMNLELEILLWLYFEKIANSKVHQALMPNSFGI